MNNIKKYPLLFVVLITCVFLVYPIFYAGFFPIHDNVQAARIYQMASALFDGQFPVRIVRDLGYGYGYPIFNFYAPFPYYIGAFFGAAFQDYLLATKVMMSIPVFVSGIGMYYFINRVLGKMEALTAAAVYILFPYLAVNIYVRGAVGETYAYSFLPFVFLGIYNIYKHLQKEKGLPFTKIIFSSIVIALVVISHNLTALVLVMFLGVYMTILFLINNNRQQFLKSMIIMLLLSFALSSFYFIPAIFEMKYTNISSQIGGGADYKDHFVCVSQFWNSTWGFGGSTNTCLDGMSFRLGKANIIFVLMSIIFGVYMFVSKMKRPNAVFISVTLIFFLSTFMATEWSKFLWDNLPFMKYLQYPWRLLNFAGFSISVLIAFLIYFLLRLNLYKLHFVAIGIILISTLYFNFKLFRPQEYFTASSQTFTDLEYLRFDASRVSDEYLPQNFDKPVKKSDLTPIIESRLVPLNLWLPGELSGIEDRSNYVSAKVNIEKASHVRAKIAYFPAWKAFIDKKPTEYKVTENSLVLDIPSGNHLVEFKFIQTAIEKFANALSLIAIVISILGIIKHGKRRKYGKTS